MTPTEAHWTEAERQYDAFDGDRGDTLPSWEPWAEAMADLVAQGAKADPAMPLTSAEIDAAYKLVNDKVGQPRFNPYGSYTDTRFRCIASMMKSLGQSPATGDPLTDTERAGLLGQIADRDAKLAAIKAAGGW